MAQTRILGKPTAAEMGGALLLYLVTIGMSLAFLAQRPATSASLLGASAVIAAGTLAMTLWLRNRTAYPRRAFVLAGVVLAASALLGPLLAGNQAGVAESVRTMLWMLPWFPMTMAWTSRPRSGICAATSPWAGPLLVGTAVLLSVIIWGAVALATLL